MSLVELYHCNIRNLSTVISSLIILQFISLFDKSSKIEYFKQIQHFLSTIIIDSCWISPYSMNFSDNILCNGDHVSWHTPLDGSESRLQHMLMTEDTQLQPTSSVLGSVNFIQVNCFQEINLTLNSQHILVEIQDSSNDFI